MKQRIVEIGVGDILMRVLQAVADGRDFDDNTMEAVFCVHGFPDNFHSFDRQLEVLTNEGYCVYSVSLPGYTPKSLIPGKDYGSDNIGNYMLLLMDNLGLANVHYVGHDFGGCCIPSMVAKAPEKFLTICVVAINTFEKTVKDIFASAQSCTNYWYSNMIARTQNWAVEVIPHNNYAFIDIIWKNWAPGWKYSDKDIQQVKDDLDRPGVLADCLNYYWCEPSVVNVAQYTMPLLFMYGNRDGCTYPGMFEKVDGTIYTGGYKIVPIDAGHFPQRENPEQFNQVLLSFLRENRNT